MIIIEKLEKIFGNRKLFKNLNITFFEKGLYGITGESGTGKTTLLNLISSIDNDYYGNITINGYNLKTMKEKERREFRYNNFGYIFQSFNLFEDETVFQNIELVYEGNKLNKEIKKQNIIDILNALDIYNIKDEYVNNLSGGEKQRVAIARALINKPKIIFCDEPTGSLDEKNAETIFEILKKISNTTLVILVSHDKELVNKYCDYIFDMKDKELIKNKPKYINNDEIFIVSSNEKSAGKLSFKYIFRNIKNVLKIKKGRYLLSSSIFSLSLICLGLTLFISNNVSQSINKAFGTIVNENSLLLQRKNQDNQISAYSASEIDILNLKKEYNEGIEYIGCKYLVNFPSFFVDENRFFVYKGDFSKELSFLTATSINEFSYLTEETKLNNNFYPSSVIDNPLKNDEIIVSLDYLNMEKLCKDLRIVRSYESLGEHLKDNNVQLILKVRNDNWNYSDEQLFRLVGIMQSPQTKIYHTNVLFNKFVFEDSMRLPTTNNMLEVSYYPWVMKKVYYLKAKTFQTQLINKILENDKYKNFLFDSDNSTYSPSLCKVNELCHNNRIFVFRSLNDIFEHYIIDEIYKTNNKFSNYYYTTFYGYANYGNSLFNGFASPLYFSLSDKDVNKIVTSLEKIPVNNNEVKFDNNIARGYVLDTNSENVKFSITYDGAYRGKETLDLNEIAISSALASKLSNIDLLNKDIYLTLNYSSESNGKDIFNKFKTIKLKIGGIVDSDRYQIYQKPDFSIYLFRDFFEISVFSLIPQAVVYEFNEKPSEKEIRLINNKFQEYELIDPFEPINNSVNEVFGYIDLGLSVFTIFASLSTIVLLFVINTINFEEEKRNITILKLIGFDDLEIAKMQLIKNFAYTLPSLLTSSFSLIILSIFISKMIAEILGLSMAYTLPLSSFLGIALLTIFLTLISFIFIYFNTKNKENYQNLH